MSFPCHACLSHFVLHSVLGTDLGSQVLFMSLKIHRWPVSVLHWSLSSQSFDHWRTMQSVFFCLLAKNRLFRYEETDWCIQPVLEVSDRLECNKSGSLATILGYCVSAIICFKPNLNTSSKTRMPKMGKYAAKIKPRLHLAQGFGLFGLFPDFSIQGRCVLLRFNFIVCPISNRKLIYKLLKTTSSLKEYCTCSKTWSFWETFSSSRDRWLIARALRCRVAKNKIRFYQLSTRHFLPSSAFTSSWWILLQVGSSEHLWSGSFVDDVVLHLKLQQDWGFRVQSGSHRVINRFN